MDRLPTELIDHILSLFPSHELQATTFNLLLALGPSHNISQSLLFKHVHLTREGQAFQCFRRLKELEGLNGSVKTADVEVWRDDPQLIVNLLTTFSALRSLSLTVGPLFAPEQLEEMLQEAEWRRSIGRIAFRFNPFTMERSYYTFLKGAYFDSTLLKLASWSLEQAPNLTKLSFIQDLPPNYGAPVKATPAFGLHRLRISDSGDAEVEEEKVNEAGEQGLVVTTEFQSKMDFAQPIVFFKLFSLTTLSLSPIGSKLTHLRLRLPYRPLSTTLTTLPPSTSPIPVHPFPSLLHLDLSTTHFPSQTPRLPLFLLIHPLLQYLVLDRCSGLVGRRELAEPTGLATLRWLGKCFGAAGVARVEDAKREWKKRVKGRPTGVAAPGPPREEDDSDEDVRKKRPKGRSGGFGNMPRASSSLAARKLKTSTPTPAPTKIVWASSLPPPVTDILICPPFPHAKSLGLGLYADLPTSVGKLWRENFEEGYVEGIDKTLARADEILDRWRTWSETGKLVGKRLVGFRDALPPGFDDTLKHATKELEEETDEEFRLFCLQKCLLPITPPQISETKLLISAKIKEFVFCTVPDCSGMPGIAHVSLGSVGREKKEVREEREKRCWEKEGQEKLEWWKGVGGVGGHKKGCAHLVGRGVWDDEI